MKMEKLTMAKVVRSKYFDIFLSAMSALMLFLVATSFYWYFKDYKVIEWGIDNYEMQKEVYTTGEPLTFRTSFCKYSDLTAELIYHIEDGVTYLLPRQVTKSEKGCRDFISSTFPTPNIPSGKYKLTGVAIYQVNPLKQQTYSMESNWFYIDNPNDGGLNK